MEIREFGPDEADDVRRFVGLTNAVSAVDSPWGHPMTEPMLAGQLRYGWDLEPGRPFLTLIDGEPVAQAVYQTSKWDNQHIVGLWVAVHPEHRRRRHGSELIANLLDRARSEGRTSAIIDGWESDGTRAFARQHGFEQKSQAIQRRQHLDEVDCSVVDKLYDDAEAAASSYELVRRTGATPDDQLADLARLTESINDAPTDDLEIEDEVITDERVRNYEKAQLARDCDLHRIVARHRETGELAGHTVVVVEREQPMYGHQHDTSVARTHRGHKLGVLLKTDMLRWLREEQPQIESIDTWNTESNDHMIEINELLGYRIMGRGLEFQRDI